MFYLTCSHQICKVSVLKKELSNARENFVAIAIPDNMSGCIFESKLLFLVCYLLNPSEITTYF